MSVTSHEDAYRTGGAERSVRVDDVAARGLAAQAARRNQLRALPSPQDARLSDAPPQGQRPLLGVSSSLPIGRPAWVPSAPQAQPLNDGTKALATAPVLVPALPTDAAPVPEGEILALVDAAPTPVSRPLAPPISSLVADSANIHPRVPQVQTASAPAMGAKYRLTLRGQKAVLAAGFAAAILVGAITGTILGNTAPAGETSVVTVQQGDSLWSIAGSVAEPGADLRGVIDEITSLNDLTGSRIIAGMPLLVPSP